MKPDDIAAVEERRKRLEDLLAEFARVKDQLVQLERQAGGDPDALQPMVKLRQEVLEPSMEKLGKLYAILKSVNAGKAASLPVTTQAQAGHTTPALPSTRKKIGKILS